jgi:hypothetical protein
LQASNKAVIANINTTNSRFFNCTFILILIVFKTPNIPPELFDLNLCEFLQKNEGVNQHDFLLQNNKLNQELRWWLAEQLKIYGKGNTKLPTFAQNFIWFTAKSYEQCSSEACALFKTTLLGGNVLIDLSGGLGVDDWAFSKVFNHVISVDSDENLNSIVVHNFRQLQVNNVQRITQTAEQFLEENSQKADAIFIDADRRPTTKKQILLEECSPNVLAIAPACFKIAPVLLLKLSPLIDITYCIKRIPQLKAIYLVEHHQELKEVLCLCDSNYTGEAEVVLVNLNVNKQLTVNWPKQPEVPYILPQVGLYIYDTGPAVRKLQAGKLIAQAFGFGIINHAGSFLGSESLKNYCYGKIFKVKAVLPFKEKQIKTWLNQQLIQKANIIARAFKLKPQEIAKKLAIKEGGNDYLLFTKTVHNQLICVHAELL